VIIIIIIVVVCQWRLVSRTRLTPMVGQQTLAALPKQGGFSPSLKNKR
jgi:hypothetical protein